MISFRLGLVFAVAALTSVGCMNARAPDAGERAEKRWDDLGSRTALNLRYETCMDGEPFGANCGLLLERATTEDFRTSFVQKRCEGVDEATCQARFDLALDEWLAERYYAADPKYVARTCKEHPGACDSPAQYELLLLQSHNRFVKSDTERLAMEIRSDYEQDRQRERDAEEQAAAAAASAAVLSGVMLTTHGHNHPSVFCAP